ncbi:MAG TPA: adenylate/guanylate cyclase domain-containing protein [Candidatus Acidoferrum sp.]|jgi:class 3 adenylate cyclase|nr:adenylate/guanylate cyclase domain-containing protein [Candidatus Acidoferrum sp.]
MGQLNSKNRARLPKSAFAYVDSRGRKRLPINDEAHVRNALARFNQVTFEDDTARERARKKLLTAAKKYGIVPIGFMSGQLQSQTNEATAGRLVIELGQVGTPGEFERRLRAALRDPTLSVWHWSESARTYLDGAGRPAALPADGQGRAVTLLERQGRPMTALVHDPAVLENPNLVKTVTAAVRLALENERLRGQVEAQTSEARTLPTGHVTFLLTDIEGSTELLQRLGDRYAALLADVRAIIRSAVHRGGGREVDARADEFFAVFERAPAALDTALAVERTVRGRTWPEGVEVRLRTGVHSGRPTLTDTGYVGLAVHTVARICAAAHGGQILLSTTARDSVGRARPTGTRLRSLGAHRLRGLRDRQVLFQVDAAGLPARFPPPRTQADSSLTNP